MDLPIIVLHELAYEVQADAGAFFFGGAVGGEGWTGLFEERGELGGGNPYPIVLYMKGDGMIVQRMEQTDGPAGVGEFDGIADDILKDDLQLLLIAPYGHAGGDLIGHVYLFLTRQ